jgi:hypothetical protein
MKEVMKSVLTILTLSLVLWGCDVITEPIKDWDYNPDDTTETVLRKVLIEDFTGHRCKNCPDAAKKLKELKDFYGDRVIGMAVHAGPAIFVGVTPEYPTDFTTPQGNQIYSFFKIPGLPMGMISRKDWTSTGSSHLKSVNSWPTNTAAIIATEAKIKISGTVAYNGSNRQITVNGEVESLADFTDDLKIAIAVTESGIVAPQLMPDDTRNATYVHNDVLRTMLTQALGDQLAVSPVAKGAKFPVQYSIALSSDWVEANCQVIIYVINNSNNEILQVEKLKIQP